MHTTHRILIALTPLLVALALSGGASLSHLRGETGGGSCFDQYDCPRGTWCTTSGGPGGECRPANGKYAESCWVHGQCISGMCMASNSAYGNGICGCASDGECQEWSGYSTYQCRDSYCKYVPDRSNDRVVELNIPCTVVNMRDPCMPMSPTRSDMGYVSCAHVGPDDNTGTCQFVQQRACGEPADCPNVPTGMTCTGQGECVMSSVSSVDDEQCRRAETDFADAETAHAAARETWDEAQNTWGEEQGVWTDAKETYAEVKAAYKEAAGECKEEYTQALEGCKAEETKAERKTCASAAKSERTACIAPAKAEALEGKSLYASAQQTRTTEKSAYPAFKAEWRSAERIFKAAQKTYNKATKACD